MDAATTIAHIIVHEAAHATVAAALGGIPHMEFHIDASPWSASTSWDGDPRYPFLITLAGMCGEAMVFGDGLDANADGEKLAIFDEETLTYLIDLTIKILDTNRPLWSKFLTEGAESCKLSMSSTMKTNPMKF